MSVQDEEAIAALARVLAHETCVRLIDALSGGEATVSDLACRGSFFVASHSRRTSVREGDNPTGQLPRCIRESVSACDRRRSRLRTCET